MFCAEILTVKNILTRQRNKREKQTTKKQHTRVSACKQEIRGRDQEEQKMHL